MDRLTSHEISDLLEAYNVVYAPKEEVIEEEVEQIDEMGRTMTTGQATAPRSTPAAKSAPAPQLKGLGIGPGGFRINNQPVKQGMSPIFQRPGANPAPSASRPAPAASRPAAAASASRPAPAASRPAAAPAAKVAPTKAQTGDKAKDMATWAKANPTLAAKVKPGQSGYSEIQKSRAASGGSSAAPAAAKMNASNVTKTAFSGSTPALAKPLSSAAATAATTKSVDTTTPAQSKVAAAPKPITMGSKKPGSAFEEVEVDVFDLVLEYLIDNGHADTIEEAHYIMSVMDTESIDNIVEVYRDPAENTKRYEKARKAAARRAEARNTARAQGKTGAVPGVGYVSGSKPEKVNPEDKLGGIHRKR